MQVPTDAKFLAGLATEIYSTFNAAGRVISAEEAVETAQIIVLRSVQSVEHVKEVAAKARAAAE